MHLRRSLLSLAIFLVGVSALPAPPEDTASPADTLSPVATATDSPTTTPKQHTHTTLATTPTDVKSQVVQTTSVEEAGVKTPDNTASPTPSPAQTTLKPSTTQVIVAVTKTDSATSVQANTRHQQPQTLTTPDSASADPTGVPSLTGDPSPSGTSSSSSTTANDAPDTEQSSGSSHTKTILIIGGTVGGLVIVAFLAFSIFRKLKLKPSRSFEQRMEPSAGQWEEWNDPRTFRGYTQNPSPAPSLHRSNSRASSKYSFDEMDEKAGGGVATLMRGNTIRHFAQEKVYPMETGDGLREDGRGYRGF